MSCSECEYIETLSLAEWAPKLVLVRPCPDHIPNHERYRLARDRYVRSGSKADLASMLEYVEGSRDEH